MEIMCTRSECNFTLPAIAPFMSTSPASGPHTGALVTKLPVKDLLAKKGGAWKASVNLKQSAVVSFQGRDALRVFFKRLSGTSMHPFPEASGACIKSKAAGLDGARAAVVTFDILFDANTWKWSGGGKLGGLFVGSGAASGGKHTADGASHRVMWQKDGGAISYLYMPAGIAQSNPALAGDHFFGTGVHHDRFAKVFKVGQWNRVELGLRLNTFGPDGTPRADGVSSLTINGVTGVLEGLVWAASPATTIRGFDYNAFFGGPDPALQDCAHYVTNFEVHAWK